MTLTLEEIIERVVQRYDPDEIVEALDITSDDLLEIPQFIEKLTDNLYKFEEVEGE